MFLLNMLVVGLVETGPDTFLLQLQAETGEIVEYTVSKNDKNLFLIRITNKSPIGGITNTNYFGLLLIIISVARYAR